MAGEVARLVPIHQAAAPFYQLPQDGSVTIGRRTNCTVVLSDGVVSGLHCVLRRVEMDSFAYEVEDKSTNGIFVNEVRVIKGESAKLVHGDVLSLGKAVEEYGGAPSSIRPQFRLEVQQEKSLELLGQLSVTSRELRSDVVSMDEALTAPTSLENQPAKMCAISSGASTAEGFAQDLLVQEQKSKAKITGELLLVRRRLDEERAAHENVDRELRKARAILEEERARRSSVKEGLDRLQAENEQLRQDHQCLCDLREEHSALETKHDAVEVELNALLQCATSLEAGHEHLRMDLQRASSDEARTRSQLAEVQARLQQAQERIESSQKKHVESRRSAEAGQESIERWQRELSNERGKREQLEDQITLLRADADRASHGEVAAKEALGAVETHCAELQTQVAKCREEAVALRAQVKQNRTKLEGDSQEAEHLRGAGSRFVEALRAYADSWARGLAEGSQPSRSTLGPLSPSSMVTKKILAAVTDAAAKEVLTDGQLPDDSPPKVKDANVPCIAVPHSSTPPPQAVAIGRLDETMRPAEPKGEEPATGVASKLDQAIAPMTAELTAALQGQSHGMASLIVGSQDSPPLPAARSPEKDRTTEPGHRSANAFKPVKLDADVNPMQRLASASILTLVTPVSKRSLQPASAGRKRLRAH